MTPVPACPYCGKDSQKVGGADIYVNRPDLREKWFYRCRPCGAYVGCHPGTDKPLGRLANLELRAAKISAHAAFDPRWKGQSGRVRRDAYKRLADQLGIARGDCHIGMFDVEMCRRVVEVCNTESSGTSILTESSEVCNV